MTAKLIETLKIANSSHTGSPMIYILIKIVLP